MSDSGGAEYRRLLGGESYVVFRRAHFLITGSDRASYLNGQITQSVDGLAADECRHGCALDARGRLVCDFHFHDAGDAYHLDVPKALGDAAAHRFGKYIIAEDVAIGEVSEGFVLYHLPCRGGVPEDLPEGVRVLRSSRFGPPGMDLIGPAATSWALEKVLRGQGIEPAPDRVVESVRVEHGFPAWGGELDGGTLPPEAGLDERCVSYTKGCYLGQEVISRIRSVGSPSRRLCVLVPVGGRGGGLRPGMELLAADDGGRARGVITSVAHSFHLDKEVALGYLKRGHNAVGTRVLVDGGDGGTRMELEVTDPITE